MNELLTSKVVKQLISMRLELHFYATGRGYAQVIIAININVFIQNIPALTRGFGCNAVLDAFINFTCTYNLQN